jgi:hypothetical protein
MAENCLAGCSVCLWGVFVRDRQSRQSNAGEENCLVGRGTAPRINFKQAAGNLPLPHLVS